MSSDSNSHRRTPGLGRAGKLFEELRAGYDESEQFYSGMFDQLEWLAARLGRQQEQLREEAAAGLRYRRRMEKLLEAVEQERASLRRACKAAREQTARLAAAVTELNSARDALAGTRRVVAGPPNAITGTDGTSDELRSEGVTG